MLDSGPLTAMLEEYRTLRSELMSIHSRQQINVVQGLVVIGGQLVYVADRWGEEIEELPLLCLALGIPLCCYTILLTAAANFARGRQIGEYLAILERKVSQYCKQECSEPAMEWMNWFFKDNFETRGDNRFNRIFLRFDLVTMLFFFVTIIPASLYLAYCYSADGNIGTYVMINLAIAVICGVSIIFILQYVQESKKRVVKDYQKQVGEKI